MNANKFIWVIIFCLSTITFGQEKESDRLKKDQKELIEKINFTEKLLETTKANKSNITENLTLLERKIEYRKDLLNNLDIQLSQLDAQISNLEIEILKLEQQIIRHKDQYKLMILQAYKMRSSDAALMFILSSESFNQANKRMEYLNQLKKYREEQIKKIQKAKLDLENLLIDLEAKREEKKMLADEKNKEQSRYVNDRELQKKTIDELQGKEKQLQDELDKQKKQVAELNRKIKKAIEDEIRAANENNGGAEPTVEEKKELELSNKGFEANKGRLPWPVKSGQITRKFGKSPHPVYSTVFIDNPGIDITTVKGSTVRAVYEGEVRSIFKVDGAGKAVMIKHGSYYTIYSNLQETYVNTGDKVSARQEIGALLVNTSGTSVVHFEVRKVSGEGKISNINPTYWLAR